MCNIHGLLISLLQVREILLAPIRSILNEFALTEQQWRIISALANDDTVGLGPGIPRVGNQTNSRMQVRHRFNHDASLDRVVAVMFATAF
ncbi:hypothetical protein [Burkholderia gladioli]|uniref:hypothetical protein n=1 Tax=Burkholderia gladioli TaxID=28095 RepID=UPI00163F8D87